jgi:2-keto-4-pentenoate hydratase/2-oxohepta-3-ene-1,7-dioic acid hydratase in catechol pathway
VDGAVVGVIVLDERAIRLDRVDGPLAGLSVDDLLASWERAWPALVDLVERHEDGRVGPEALVEVAEATVMAPLRPGKLLQSGMNYHRHVVDLIVARARTEDPDTDLDSVRAEAVERMERRAAEGEPFVFVGLAGSMCGPYDDVILPALGTDHDWELELGVVIGTGGRHIGRDRALDHVAGYVACNDLTTRDLVFSHGSGGVGADWFRSKNAPTFFPTGPWLVPAVFVPDPGDLVIQLRHNGDVMQDESTADMIFDVAHLVEFCSTTVPLAPGDLILTGSPAGNGAHWGRVLAPGDVMEATITVPGLAGPGFGTQRNACVAEADGDRPHTNRTTGRGGATTR